MIDQDYTSNLLCHFVGQSEKSDDDRYELLKKIIVEDSELKANIDKPGRIRISLNLKDLKENKGELYERCDCVCFCDIPYESLKIHRQKYSSFGLGFKKAYLISKGARPVMYVPQSHYIRDFLKVGPSKAPNDYFDTLDKEAYAAISLLLLINDRKSFKTLFNNILESENPKCKKSDLNIVYTPLKEYFDEDKLNILFTYLYSAWVTECAYIKIFDDTLDKNDKDNYYMEREWRCLGSVKFLLEDIDTIFLPNKQYEERFRKDVPKATMHIKTFDDYKES